MDILLLATLIFCVVGFEKLIFAVKMEHVKMPLESQVEKCLPIGGFRSAGTLLTLDLVLHVCLRDTSRPRSTEVRLTI